MDNSEKNGATATAGSNNSGWIWTNERHVHFLNSIEATFVRTMLENVDGHGAALPLDRQMPDSLESTLDLGKDRRSPDVAQYSYSNSSSTNVKIDKKNKRLRVPSPRHIDDQVVPQLEKQNR